jgi:hypothetical protein
LKIRINEPEIHLVNQGGGLEGVSLPLSSKSLSGRASKLFVDKRQQGSEGLLFASAPRREKLRDFPFAVGLSHAPK